MSATDDTWTTVTQAAQVTPEIAEIAYEHATGYYTLKGERIDWEDVIDRTEGTYLADGTRLDLGAVQDSGAIRKIKSEVRRMLREEA